MARVSGCGCGCGCWNKYNLWVARFFITCNYSSGRRRRRRRRRRGRERNDLGWKLSLIMALLKCCWAVCVTPHGAKRRGRKNEGEMMNVAKLLPFKWQLFTSCLRVEGVIINFALFNCVCISISSWWGRRSGSTSRSKVVQGRSSITLLYLHCPWKQFSCCELKRWKDFCKQFYSWCSCLC